MIEIASFLVKVVGVAFLLVATIGMLRFEDTLQRMHAATKAGTLGAGLVLVGTMMNKGNLDATLTAGLTLLFLILTIPVASHLLARAAYVSGARLAGIGDDDALRGVLDRPETSIEDELTKLDLERRALPEGDATPAPLVADPVLAELGEADFASLKTVITPERVRFAAVGDAAPQLARRAAGLAARTALPLTAVVAVDTGYVDATQNSAETLRLIRDKVSHWLPDLRSISDDMGVPIDLVYEEGDAEALMAGVGDVREFLVLPTDGWADHGIGIETPHATKEPDGLLRVAGMHPGPVMYAVDEQKAGPVAVRFDGSYDIWRGLDLAIVEGLWTCNELRIFGFVDGPSRREIERRAEEAKMAVRFFAPDLATREGAMFPDEAIDGAVAVIVSELPRPLRTRWYGVFWQDKIAPDWRGDVLIWT
ncbi:MAG: monovalent cation/H(+) antiporter subunit G [Devosiaceae bacterium]|nr:monovalent cation/H(+) antiporter subunit G [Devosiaceae bacterium MH13]